MNGSVRWNVVNSKFIVSRFELGKNIIGLFIGNRKGGIGEFIIIRVVKKFDGIGKKFELVKNSIGIFIVSRFVKVVLC